MPFMITSAEMEHLKKLARLELSGEETEQIQLEMNKILSYFEKLQELDTEGVEEMQRPIDLVNVFRDDVVGDMFPHETAMGLSVEQEEGFFKVPRVVE
ncbi:glutamyl-tRNA(Gln) amidotransferase subunit C [Deinococcus cellulosilyticus NBRC 106333 = KACC 11606]|uniref:Aspartyl/glutamyl-tRNA(Asn/Gln) amidotransferase subunit C n=2 Tax=Deinococcus cellulosilyticus TaxID=401558 RepID=A0A511N3S4_DEIC1|nr:glutamyl-tRNA(Gln) amidotransferase subunit C [Deinococcus cellulosilyticus NBRC 106333 = KACC 11606]